MAALKAGRFEQAVTHLDKAAKADPKNAQAKRFLAKAYEGAWDWGAAATVCRDLARFGLADAAAIRQHAAWLAAFGDLIYETHDGVSSQEEAQLKAIAADPYAHGFLKFAASEALGKHYYSAGRHKDAERYYDALSKAPESFRTGRYYADRADLFIKSKRFADAERLLHRLAARPKGAMFNTGHALARCYGEWAKAESAKAKPNWAQVVRLLTRARQQEAHAYLWDYVAACERTKRFTAAARALDAALAAPAKDASAAAGMAAWPTREELCARKASLCLTWAEYCKRRKQFDKVAELYRMAKDLDPNATPGVSAETLAKDSEDAARALLEEAKQVMNVVRNCRLALLKFQTIVLNFPDTSAAVDAEFQAAYCYRRIGKPERALRLFGEFAKQHPNHPLMPEALLRRIYILADRGRHPKQAIAECNALMARDPGCKQAAEASYLRGMYYALMLKDNPAALKCFRQTQSLYPQSTWATHWAHKRIQQLQQ